VVTATTGGRRSGRDRKSQAPFEGVDETFGVGHTFGVLRDPPFGVLAFETRSRWSQPIVFIKAKYVTPTPAAARNRRRLNLALIV